HVLLHHARDLDDRRPLRWRFLGPPARRDGGDGDAPDADERNDALDVTTSHWPLPPLERTIGLRQRTCPGRRRARGRAARLDSLARARPRLGPLPNEERTPGRSPAAWARSRRASRSCTSTAPCA